MEDYLNCLHLRNGLIYSNSFNFHAKSANNFAENAKKLDKKHLDFEYGQRITMTYATLLRFGLN